MGRYLTPLILKRAGTGLPLDLFSDAELDGIIRRGENDIDRFMGFREDQGGFATGIRTAEKHPWFPGNRRIYPNCRPTPIQQIIQYQVVVSQNAGTGQYVAATPDPTTALVNNDLGYVELVALSVIAYGLAPVISQFSVIEIFASVTYLAGYQVPVVGERLYPIDLERTTYSSMYPAWDTTVQTPVIYKDGVALGGGYTVLPQDGAVLFSVPTPSVHSAVTADFTSQIPAAVTMAVLDCLQDGPLVEALLNLQGLYGADAVRSGVRAFTRRRKLLGLTDQWQANLEGLKIPTFQSTGN